MFVDKPWIKTGQSWQEWCVALCNDKYRDANGRRTHPMYAAYLELCVKTNSEPR